MTKSVRTWLIAVSTIMVLFAMQTGVSAKKKSSKRKQRTTRAAVIVTPPVLTSEVDGSFSVNSAPATATAPAPQQTRTGGMSIDGAGDGGNGGKRSKGRVTISPTVPDAVAAGF